MRKKTKILIGVFVPLGIIAVFLTVFLSVIFQAKNIRAGIGATDGSYDQILGDIEGIVKANPRIVDIARSFVLQRPSRRHVRLERRKWRYGKV